MTPSYGYKEQDGVKQGKLTVTSSQGTDYDRANIPDGVDDPVAFEKKFGRGSSYIAAISADLVDHGRIVEIEQIDFDKLPKRYFYRFVKRIFDIVSSACALIVLAIPMLIIAIAIKLDSQGPVFYRQERLGLNGAPFKLIKFRSMRTDAEANGAQWAQANDPRITKVGRFIRKTRLDEVPQFFQVISGELPLRILKMRQVFSKKQLGAFALPANEVRTVFAVFSQVNIHFVIVLRALVSLFCHFNADCDSRRAIFANPIFASLSGGLRGSMFPVSISVVGV